MYTGSCDSANDRTHYVLIILSLGSYLQSEPMTPIINEKGAHVGLDFDHKTGDVFYSDKSLHFIAKANIHGSCKLDIYDV